MPNNQRRINYALLEPDHREKNITNTNIISHNPSAWQNEANMVAMSMLCFATWLMRLDHL